MMCTLRRFATASSVATSTIPRADITVLRLGCRHRSFPNHNRLSVGMQMSQKAHQRYSKIHIEKVRRFHAGTTLFFSDSNESAATKHQLYLQQIQELESERNFLFGSSIDENISTLSTTMANKSESTLIEGEYPDSGGESQRIPIDMTDNRSTNTLNIEENKVYREEIYGFTAEERNAWSAIGSNNSSTHSKLLRDIELAREREEEERKSDTKGKSELYTNETSATASSFSHLTVDERQIHMVDVGSKEATRRTATAQTLVAFPPEVMRAFNKTDHRHDQASMTKNAAIEEWNGPKGPIFATAITAGIMGVKQTSSLIPLCHPLPIENIQIDIRWFTGNTIQIQCTCSVTHKTGVEMEALMGCSIAALTIYDMVKAISHNVHIIDTKLLYKDGGKSTFGMR
jgi:cyclic pyranopterin monophosphate synthase